MEKYTYKIGNKTLKLKKITTGALIELSSFIMEYKENKEVPELNFDKIKDLMVENFSTIAAKIFPNQTADEIDWMEIDAEITIDIITDFFFLNEKLIIKLLGSVKNIIMETAKVMQ